MLGEATENPRIRTIEDIAMTDFEKKEEMQTGIYLNDALQEQIKDGSTKLILTFFFKNNLFYDEAINASKISGNIVGVIFSNDTFASNGSFW